MDGPSRCRGLARRGRTSQPGEHARDGGGDALPVARLFRKLLPSLARKLVELRLAVVFRVAPLRVDQALLLEPMQRRIERSLVYLQDVIRYLLDALGNTPSVHWSLGEGPQDQEIQGPLQQI